MWKNLRKCFAIASLIIGGTAVAIPDLVWSKVLMAFATGLNAAALYLIKEEQHVESEEAGETQS